MRRLHISAILMSVAFASALLCGQGRGGSSTGSIGGGTTGTSGSSGASTAGSLPSSSRSTLPTTTSNTNTSPDGVSRGTFFYGKVLMQDGSAPPTQVVVERVCGGSVRPQAYADSKGNFSFQLGQTQEMMQDASVGRSGNGIGTNSSQTSSQSSTLNLTNCELRASLPGFRSDTVSLTGRRSLDDPNVGTILLHRLSNVEGLTTSATSALAPKDAQKAFEKGVAASKKAKIDDAQASFLKATELYPRYASAWYELGRVYEQRDHIAEAREAYAKSIAADSKFVNPYERLYLLSMKEQKWEDVAATTDRIMRLNPYDFPNATYYNAVANLQLNKLDVAEKSAREAAALDVKTSETSKNPKINYVLAVILARKEDFKGSAEFLRIYLKSDTIPDRERVTKMLADIEKQVEARAETKPQP